MALKSHGSFYGSTRGHDSLFETEDIDIPAPPLVLYQNVPNPFNPSTAIGYYLPRGGRVTLAVYDVCGGLVTYLVKDEQRERGHHSVEWNGVDASDRPVASGVYFYRLKVAKKILTKKLVIVK